MTTPLKQADFFASRYNEQFLTSLSVDDPMYRFKFVTSVAMMSCYVSDLIWMVHNEATPNSHFESLSTLRTARN